MLEGGRCLLPGQVQCLLNYFPIITASCMEWLLLLLLLSRFSRVRLCAIP